MFHLFYGNDLRGLARELGEHLRRPCTNVLVPDIVLVPQAGMRRWLEIELAESLGIVANVDFRLPGEFINTLLAAGAGSRPRHGAFDREVLRWRLMPLLAQLASEPVGAPIAHYLRGDAAQLRRQQLAREFAAALERYQAYRRDVLREWEAGGSPHDWQAEAWRRLARTTDEPHRARLIDAFLARYAGSTDAPANLPERLSVFGCLGLSPDALRVLGVLGRHCDVDFYLPSPCIEYWGDERAPRERLRAGASPLEAPAQPLLASWGRVGREVFEQVFSYEEVQPADEVACVREPARTTLLGRIQSDILHLQAPDPDARLQHLDPDDVSLRAHECHSPLREVQVLHDHLLALFERDPTLKPRDIAVMVPDVAAYAPVIDAVFGALPAGDFRRIPYTVADLAAGDEHPVTRLFLTLLSLPVSRWGVSDVLDLLAVPAVMRRHGLDADTLERLGHWFELAGVRWGLDAGTRVAFGAGNYRAFTWAEGIERLLLGYATGNDTESAGIVPVPAVEGSAATALGQALLVLRELEQLATAQRTPRPAASWQALYQHALDALLPDAGADQDERRARALVRGAIAALADGAAAGSCDEALDWQCVREFLAERLAEPDPRQRFLGGGVSFCGMVPLRAIPFRVIALLGMDDAAFPRREPANGINRLEQDLRQARRPGDRSVRDDDRYLFLQVLTSAADALHRPGSAAMRARASGASRPRWSANCCAASAATTSPAPRDWWLRIRCNRLHGLPSTAAVPASSPTATNGARRPAADAPRWRARSCRRAVCRCRLPKRGASACRNWSNSGATLRRRSCAGPCTCRWTKWTLVPKTRTRWCWMASAARAWRARSSNTGLPAETRCRLSRMPLRACASSCRSAWPGARHGSRPCSVQPRSLPALPDGCRAAIHWRRPRSSSRCQAAGSSIARCRDPVAKACCTGALRGSRAGTGCSRGSSISRCAHGRAAGRPGSPKTRGAFASAGAMARRRWSPSLAWIPPTPAKNSKRCFRAGRKDRPPRSRSSRAPPGAMRSSSRATPRRKRRTPLR